MWVGSWVPNQNQFAEAAFQFVAVLPHKCKSDNCSKGQHQFIRHVPCLALFTIAGIYWCSCGQITIKTTFCPLVATIGPRTKMMTTFYGEMVPASLLRWRRLSLLWLPMVFELLPSGTAAGRCLLVSLSTPYLPSTSLIPRPSVHDLGIWITVYENSIVRQCIFHLVNPTKNPSRGERVEKKGV